MDKDFIPKISHFDNRRFSFSLFSHHRTTEITAINMIAKE